jgi:O-antigen/teichoic acid export membrane protein
LTRVTRNIAANLLANVWGIALGVAVVPRVVLYLGPEGYGLVGFFVSLAALLSFLDLGLGATVSRDMARLSVQRHSAEETRSAVRTYEAFYWGIGIVAATLVVLLAPLIARHWLNGRQLSGPSVYSAVLAMGLVVALQWPMSFYVNALMGRQEQVAANKVQIFCSTVRNVGVLVVLAKVSPTVQAYFVWQVCTYLGQTLLLALSLWRSLPTAAVRPRVDLPRLWSQRHFSLEMMAIGVLATLCVQIDRIAIGKLFTLDILGLYALAASLVALLPAMVTPVFSALFPRFTQLVLQEDEVAAMGVFHQGAQLVSAIAIPVTVVGAFFSREILVTWTGSEFIGQQCGTVLSLLFLGAGLNALLNVPHAMILARGRTRPLLLASLGVTAVLVPTVWVLAGRFAATGAACGGILYNACFLGLVGSTTIWGLPPAERRRWCRHDIGAPAAAAAACVGAFRFAVSVPNARVVRFAFLLLVAAIGGAAVLATTPLTRSRLAEIVRRRRLDGEMTAPAGPGSGDRLGLPLP